jgi:hypothetical protein
MLEHVVAPLGELGSAGSSCVREAESADNGDVAARSSLVGRLVVECRHQGTDSRSRPGWLTKLLRQTNLALQN